MRLKKLLPIGLAATLLLCGCGQSGRDPDAAFYVYSIEAERQRLVRSVRWEETEPLRALTGLLNSDTAAVSINTQVENPDYILEMVNKDHYGEVLAPIFIHLWVDENSGRVRFYSPDISAGTAPEPCAFGPYDAEESVSADFLAQVLP